MKCHTQMARVPVSSSRSRGVVAVSGQVSLVMTHAGRYYDVAVADLEYETVPLVNPDAPPSRAVILERFRFPYARIAVSVDAFDEETYSLVCLPVPFRPGFQLLPCKIRPELSHGASSCATKHVQRLRRRYRPEARGSCSSFFRCRSLSSPAGFLQDLQANRRGCEPQKGCLYAQSVGE